jgi:hypothetical protein
MLARTVSLHGTAAAGSDPCHACLFGPVPFICGQYAVLNNVVLKNVRLITHTASPTVSLPAVELRLFVTHFHSCLPPSSAVMQEHRQTELLKS